jgi:hypothetical protein
MSATDTIKPKPHIEAANGILNIQKLAIQMASFGAKKRIDIWLNPVDEFTLDYLSAYFGTSIRPKDEDNQPYLVIRTDHADIYVQLKEN